MKKNIALFVHDGPMYKDKNGVYCSTNITEEMLSRFFSVADEIHVLIRTLPIKKTHTEAKLHKVDNPRIKIYELGNVVSAKSIIFKNKLEKTIKPIVEECDLIFLRLPGITCNIVADICRKEKKKYLVEVGGCAWDAYWNHGLLGKIIAPYMEMSEKKTVRNASYATYVTRKWLQDRYPCNCESIEASNVYLPEANKKVLEKRLKKIDNYKDCKHLTIGTIANVDVRYKGQEYIIKAIAKLNKKGYHFKYELVGGGDQTFLRNLARKLNVDNAVIFKGPLLHEDVMKWLDAIDIYAQPSKQEGLPRSVIEAMSRGCPCIGSNIAGIPELLDKNGLFAPNSKQIIVALTQFLDKENLISQSKSNYIKAKEYNLSEIEKRREGIFQSYKKTTSLDTKRNNK